jgi:hypothetical protein
MNTGWGCSWDPSPGNDWWRYSILRRFFLCCSYSDAWNGLSWLFAVTFSKCSINPITNPSQVYSHSKIVITQCVNMLLLPHRKHCDQWVTAWGSTSKYPTEINTSRQADNRSENQDDGWLFLAHKGSPPVPALSHLTPSHTVSLRPISIFQSTSMFPNRSGLYTFLYTFLISFMRTLMFRQWLMKFRGIPWELTKHTKALCGKRPDVLKVTADSINSYHSATMFISPHCWKNVFITTSS